MAIINATFVSSWDNGDEVISSACKFNTETKEVTDIESVDVEELDLYYLDEERIELSSGEVIKDFNYDGIEVVGGQKQEE